MDGKQEMFFRFMKKQWSFLPLVFFLFLQLIIWGIEELTDSTLRSLPHMFLMWFGILSSLLLILELSKSFFAWGRKRGMRLLSVIKKIWYGFVVVIGIVVILIGLFISIFTYTPEHIVVQNGVRMVASVNSFLQEQVYYYEYKNPEEELFIMNKADLVAAMAEKAGVSKKDAEASLKAFTDVVAEELKKGEKIQLVGFGTFEVSERAARTGRNPQTGAEMTIAASKAPKFKAGKALKDSLN